MGTWLNSDGLYIKFGTDEATPSVAGEVPVSGVLRQVEAKIDLTLLATASERIIADNVAIPKNARIEEVELEVETGAVGATATLDIGLIGTDRSTVDSVTGLVAGAAVATLDTAGKRLNLIVGSTAAGNRIGSTLSGPRLITAGANTAVFTAGVVKLRVKYYFI